MSRSRRGRTPRDRERTATSRVKLDKAPVVEVAEADPEAVAMAALKVGQRVRLCDPFRPAGGRCMTGTVTRAGEMVDVRWDDGRTSHMLTLALVEPHEGEEEEERPD